VDAGAVAAPSLRPSIAVNPAASLIAVVALVYGLVTDLLLSVARTAQGTTARG
jgi:hypothetical protein